MVNIHYLLENLSTVGGNQKLIVKLKGVPLFHLNEFTVETEAQLGSDSAKVTQHLNVWLIS